MKKQLGGGRGGGAEAGGRRALWCNAGSESGRSLLCGGEQECDSCLSDGVVLYSCLFPSSTTRGDVAMRASLQTFCLFVSFSHRRSCRVPFPHLASARATDVPRGAAASTFKQTHSPDVMSHSSVGQRSSREAAASFFQSLQQSSDREPGVDLSTLVIDISDVVMENSSLLCGR